MKATSKLLTARYLWPNAKNDVLQWCNVCMECQRSNITRHNKAPVGAFANRDARFVHVHIDLAGPLLTYQGFTYLLTLVDSFCRWPEAARITDLSAETVAKAFEIHAGLQPSEFPRLSRQTAVLNWNPPFFNL